MPKKSLVLHPISLFSLVWIGVAALYELRLSKLLIATNEQVLATIETILLPFILIVVLVSIFVALAPKRLMWRSPQLIDGSSDQDDLFVFERRLKKWLIIWGVFSIVEVIVSGGVPLAWLFLGNGKTYFDFGLKSLHGILNSLILAIGVCYTGLFAKYGQKRHLLCFAFIIAWSVLLVSRSMLIVNIVQGAIVVALHRGIPKSLVVKLAAYGLILIFGFGVIGDLRSGAQEFRDLAQPTSDYPEWLPSGVLWVYIYLTTPLNNLIYSSRTVRPVDDILFPNTAAPLFPSRIRNIVYGDSLSESLSGDLVDQAFNVSTAYIGPYQDYGLIGIAAFSLFIGLAGARCWSRNQFSDSLVYVVIGQCLLLTSFYNHFFSLPIITQVLWIRIFFIKGRARKKAARQVDAGNGFYISPGDQPVVSS